MHLYARRTYRHCRRSLGYASLGLVPNIRAFGTDDREAACKRPHVPVMMRECLDHIMAVRPGEDAKERIFVDATFGAGGYTREILMLDDACTVIAIDMDRSVEKYVEELQAEFGRKRLIFMHGNYRDVLLKLARLSQKSEQLRRVRGIVFDLGVSSMQLDHMDRGFSYRLRQHDNQEKGETVNSPLDMRMNPDGGNPSAADLVNNMSESQLKDIIMQYGEETRANSSKIAREIIAYRTSKDKGTGEFHSFQSTQQLALVVRNALGYGEYGYRTGRDKSKKDPCTRTFQALRIYVNEELDSLKSALESSAGILKRADGTGRLAVVSYHSLEDRIVKQFQVKHTGSKGRAQLPNKEEVERNRRSRSAKLRSMKFKT